MLISRFHSTAITNVLGWCLTILLSATGCSRQPEIPQLAKAERTLDEGLCHLIELEIDQIKIEDGTHVKANANVMVRGRLSAMNGKFEPGNPKIKTSPDGRPLANNAKFCMVNVLRDNTSDKTWDVVVSKPTNQKVEKSGAELVFDVPLNLEIAPGEYWFEVNTVDKFEGGSPPVGVVTLQTHPVARRRFFVDSP